MENAIIYISLKTKDYDRLTERFMMKTLMN